MYSFRFIKFLGIFAFVLAMSPACRYCQKAGGGDSQPGPFVAEELKSEIPFSTREPEIFRVEIVTTVNETENKIFMARTGANRRLNYNFGEKNEVAFLITDKNYLMFPRQKIYAENAGRDSMPAESWTDFLTSRWLNAKTGVRFFSEGKENNLTKYRVVFSDGGNAENGASESLIFVDETVNLPVRQEFLALRASRKL